MVEVVVEEILKGKHTSVIFIGDTDTGKTTLWRLTAEALISRGHTIGLVDSDIGQASLFLPATVSAKVVSSTEVLDSRDVDFIYFVGLFNPALSLENHIRAAKRAFEFAKKRAPIVLLDTTGLVRGRYGQKLKLKKIRQVDISLVVALQRQDELEHIISHVPEERLLLLKPSPLVRQRPRTERISYRKNLFRQYFRDLYLHQVPFNKVRFLYSFTPRTQKGLLCGLVSEGQTIGLGIVEDYAKGALEVLSPVGLEKRIDRCLVGGVFLEEEVYI